MSRMPFKPLPLALVFLVVVVTLPWAGQCPAQAQDQQWRIQDYDEYENTEDSAGYDESEEDDDAGDYDDSEVDEDFEEEEDSTEYDAEEEGAGYDQADEEDSDDTEDDSSDNAEAEDFGGDEESDESDDYESVQDESTQSAAVEFESDDDSMASEESEEGGDEDSDEYAYDEHGVDEYFLDELEDDSWAPEIEFDETDDVLQTASENWGVNEVYEVVETVDDVRWTENNPEKSDRDGPGSDELPVVQRVVKEPGYARPTAKPANAGAKRPAAKKPPSTGAAKPRLKSSFGGRPVANTGVPWQAQIYAPFPAKTWPPEKRASKALWQLQHYCGGILIANDWVLTAAHCIDQEMVDSGYRVRLGSRDISRENGWTYKIDRIVRHSRYAEKPLPNNPNRYANDIALIHIVDDGKAGPRDPSRIKPIPLYRGQTLGDGTEVTVTGWGVTKAAGPAYANAVLLKVDLRVMDNATCSGLSGYGPKKIGEAVFCAANPARSTCRGDSGGAVVLTNENPVVVGIVSWGKALCSGDGRPGVYTRISSFLPWIDKAMKLPPGKNSLP